MAEADALLAQVFPYHVRGAVDAIDWIIYTHNTNIQRNIDIVCQYQGVVGIVPIFIEENRRDRRSSGFLSVVATTVRGNAAAKDLSTAENIIRPEVLRLVSCRPRVLVAGVS